MEKSNFILYKNINLEDNDILKFTSNSNIELLDNNILRLSNNKLCEYISVYEENHDIHTLPANPINLNSKSYYLIEANSKHDLTIRMELICILYSSSRVKSIITIPFNQSREISIAENSQSLRFIIRVRGRGSFSIDSIKVYQSIYESYDLSITNDNIPISQLESLSELKIACIFDAFTYECIKPICKLYEITPSNWIENFKRYKPHVFMVESAWEGFNNSWAGVLWSSNNAKTDTLRKILLWCNENKIPTIFWNKEDPISYEKFLPTAKLFDYVFTTDVNCIDKYKDFLKHDRVFPLMFAASPRIHNPIGGNLNRLEKACFAGTYYKFKFPKRCRELDTIMRAAIKSVGLDIYDRNYNLNQYQYRYPDEFQNYIVGSKRAGDLDVVNKGYKININVNSVTNSPTMFARRVFESIASGTPILSNVSVGIREVFNDLVFMGDKEDDFISEFLLLDSDKHYYDQKALKGIRLVMLEHTYENRLTYVLSKLGINISTREVHVCVIIVIHNIADIYSAINLYNKQVYNHKDLILICKEDKCVYEIIDTNVLRYKKHPLNNTYAFSNLYEKYSFIGVFNLNNFYGKYYLVDLVNATKYVDASLIGKSNSKNEHFKFVDTLDLDKCIFEAKLLRNYTVDMFISILDSNHILIQEDLTMSFFSTDPYNFINDLYSNNNSVSTIDSLIKQIEI